MIKKIILLLVVGSSIILSSCEKDKLVTIDENSEDILSTIDGSLDVWEVEAIEGGVNIIKYKGTETNIVFPTTVEGELVLGVGEAHQNITIGMVPETLFNEIEQNVVSVDLSNSKYLLAINEYAFQGSDALESVILPESIINIKKAAFSDCYYLKNINLPQGLVNIGNRAFLGCYFSEAIIPNSVKEIGYQAFCYCEELETVVIPEGITVLNSIFSDCVELKNVTLPESLTEIQPNAFQGCITLEHITIPSNVTLIGAGAFYGCTELSTVEMKAPSVTLQQGFNESTNRDYTGVFAETPLTDENRNTGEVQYPLGAVYSTQEYWSDLDVIWKPL